MLGKIALIKETYLLYLIIALFFLLPYERIPSYELAGYTIKLSYIVALILILVSLPRFISVFSKLKLGTSDKALLSFWLAGLFSIQFSPDPGKSFVVLALWLFMIILYLLISRYLSDRIVREKAITALLITTAIVIVFGLYQFIGDSLGLPQNLTGLRNEYLKTIFGFPRIQSVNLEPLYFGNFLFVPFFLAASRYVEQKKPIGAYWWLLVGILINVILGISRGVYLALAVSLVAYLVILIRRFKAGRQVTGIILAVVAAVAISLSLIAGLDGKAALRNFLGHAQVNDVSTGESIPSRVNNYEIAGQLIVLKPIFGHGPGSYAVKAPQISNFPWLSKIVNNEYFELIVETGFIGLFLFLLFILTAFNEVATRYRITKNQENKGTILALICGAAAILIQYNFFSTLYIIYIWVFWALMKSFAVTGESLDE